jgi:hypothetical protein
MGRNRSIYAPRREAAPIDWAAQQQESDRARADEARAQQQAIDAAAEFHHPKDPMQQLIERVFALEQSVAELKSERSA